MCIMKQKWYLWLWTALRAKASTVQIYYFSQDSISTVKHLSAVTDQDRIGRKKITKAQ